MTRAFRCGDRVTATGTVTDVSADTYATVHLPSGYTFDCRSTDLTLIVPDEPPIGSAVLHDGVVWVHAVDLFNSSKRFWLCGVGGDRRSKWSDICDGTVLHRADA
jgi:hypothetical protein